MTVDPERLTSLACPTGVEADRITLSHGAGAGASARLFERLLWPRFANAELGARHDGAVFAAPPAGSRLALSTDTFVVSPIEFPGGDIGTLAVTGTLNDLAMCGARPLGLSCALVLEEGLALATLERVIDSMARAASAAGVAIATGDTKVVEHGKGDGIYVNTSGVGAVPPGRDLRPARVTAGDAVLVSGTLGCHGAAVLSLRESLSFEADLESDCGWLGPVVDGLLEAVPETRCLRDPTRGGLGAALHEIAAVAGARVELDEAAIPVTPAVRSVCELLGLDPLFLACEGRLVAFVPESAAPRALAALRAHPLAAGAEIVGRVVGGSAGVALKTRLGSRRLLPLPAGDPLPRIC